MTGKPDAPLIHHAQLHWDDQGQPISSQFDDVYFSKADGLAETRHVFLHHNQLTERFTDLQQACFVIAETGFGSGLNFLATWQLWDQRASPQTCLHFVSVEKYPLTRDDLTKALALWPELSPYAHALLANYPPYLSPGFHRLKLADGRVRLTLIIADAADGFEQLRHCDHPLFERDGPRVDAWFLDGFAPAKNPEMWSDALFTHIGQLSGEGTTAATFSAAGLVKRGLKSAGFTLKKVPGHGRKREMIAARWQAEEQTCPDPAAFASNRGKSPWPLPWYRLPTATTHEKRAVIVGTGLAGCHSARALAERGWQVTLLERQPRIAAEGSGNPQGIVYARLSPLLEAQSTFNLASLQFALRHYRPFWESGDPQLGQACGVLQLAHDPAEADWQERLRARFEQAGDLVQFLTPAQASEQAGIPLQHGGLFFPSAGWLNPPALCARLLEHPAILVRTNSTVARLSRQGEEWQLLDDNGQCLAQAPVVILANAQDARHISQTADLPLKAIRGQVTYLPANEQSLLLRTVICGEGYLAPASAGQHCLGATFDLKTTDTQVRTEDHLRNLTALIQQIPSLAPFLESFELIQPSGLAKLAGRVAFRCATRDYLPLVGPAPVTADFESNYAALRKNARAGIPTPGSYWSGLYLNLGHGSRGLAYTPLASELLAAQINAEPLPVARELALALHPGRFLIRDLIRNHR